MTSAPVLILFGRPGSGKGTVAELLRAKGWIPLSTGQAMRDWAAGPSPEQKALRAALARGEYGSNELAARIVGEFISNLPMETAGVILDGFPRNLAQLDAFFELNLPATAWLIELPRAAAQRRMRHRGTCAADGSSTPKVGDACPRCGKPTTQRADDARAASLVARERTYLEQVVPIIDRWLGAELPFAKINNSGSLADLERQVGVRLRKMTKSTQRRT